MESEMTKEISGRQIAAARALLRLSKAELARKAKIQTPTLMRMEARTGEAVGLIDNIAAVRAVLESAGVEFTNGGVRLAKPKRKGKGK
jgi:hypothetical protein